jgi:hypothetical protein
MFNRFNKLLNKLKLDFSKIDGYYDKRYEMFVVYWYGFVVGKWSKEIFLKTNFDKLLWEVRRLIRRIKILYNTPKEIKNVKALEARK